MVFARFITFLFPKRRALIEFVLHFLSSSEQLSPASRLFSPWRCPFPQQAPPSSSTITFSGRDFNKSGATMLTHNYRRKFFFVDAKNSCTEEQAAQHFLSGPRYREKHFRYTKNAQGNDKLSILCGLNGITRVNVDVQQHISSLAKLVPENIVMYIHSGSSTFLRAVKRT